MFQFFEILIFSQNIWEYVHYVLEINLFSYGSLIKASYLLSKTNYMKSKTWFCRQKAAAEDTNVKINVSPNIPCTFLLFKASIFITFFPMNLLFRQVLRMPIFLNSKCLTFLYLFISLLKNICSKHQIKEHTFLYLLTNLFIIELKM